MSVPLVTYLGYAFAPQVEPFLRLLRRVEVIILIVVILMGAAVYWYRRARKRQTA